MTLAACIATPLIGLVLVLLARRHPNLREFASLATGAALLWQVLEIYPLVRDGGRMEETYRDLIPGVPVVLELEPLGMVFALVASFLWIVTTVYAIGYMRGHHEENQTRFYACFAIAISSAMGIAFAGNLFTLFIFYEILTLSTYPLVTHAGTEDARRGGRVYIFTLLGTSVGLLLFAIVWTWSATGTTDFVPGGIMRHNVDPWLGSVLYAMFVFGIGKAALMPFHGWLPAAMVAPTPVSALLHAVAVVKAGVFAILKVTVYVFGIDYVGTLAAAEWLMYVAGATILIASLIAMRKDNLKARLAYSTVSQLSYIVLGALLANGWALVGAALHIIMHAFAKITLFFCAGTVLVAAHKTEVSEMRGLGRHMPLTMAAFAIGSLSIIGMPLLGGMWSKWFLLIGALEAKELLFVGVLLVSSLLNIAYLLPVPVRAFLCAPPEEDEHHEPPRAPIACLLALGLTSLGCFVLFWYVGEVHEMLLQIVR